MRILLIIIVLLLTSFALFHKEIKSLKIFKKNKELKQLDEKKKKMKQLKCTDGFTGNECDEELMVIDYNSKYDEKYLLKDNVFTDFNSAYIFIENKDNFIGITKNKKLSLYYPVKKEATIKENDNFVSFTKPLVHFDTNFESLSELTDYSEIAKEIGMEIADTSFDSLKSFLVIKVRKAATKKALRKYLKKNIQ